MNEYLLMIANAMPIAAMMFCLSWGLALIVPALTPNPFYRKIASFYHDFCIKNIVSIIGVAMCLSFVLIGLSAADVVKDDISKLFVTLFAEVGICAQLLFMDRIYRNILKM